MAVHLRLNSNGIFCLHFLTAGGVRYRRQTIAPERDIRFVVYARQGEGWGPLMANGHEYRDLQEARVDWEKHYRKRIYKLRLVAVLDGAEPCIIERN